jgi:hypothetical protein
LRAHPSGSAVSGLTHLAFASRASPKTCMRRAPGPLPWPSRQRRLLSRTRTPSLDECSLHPAATRCPLTNCSANAQPARTGPRREPATVLAALPPRAGFRRSFALRSGEGGEARPAAVRRNGPSAARRLLQPKHSASTTARSPEPRFHTSGRLCSTDPPHPFGWDETAAATPRRRMLPRRARGPVGTEPRARLNSPRRTCFFGWCLSWGGTAPAEVSRARDQGAFARPAPSVAIARGGSFAPTRSARTPRVASSLQRWLEKPPPRTHAQ